MKWRQRLRGYAVSGQLLAPYRRFVQRSFHHWLYSAAPWERSTWMGVPARKSPFVFWVYQEIIHEQRPTLILETGTDWGGSALFAANMLDLIGAGRVVTIDVRARPERPTHPRVTYIEGSSTERTVVEEVRAMAESERVLVVLDSDHRREHVAAELAAFAPLVTSGGYVIVEDTNINGHPVRRRWGPGPHEAVDEFLAGHSEFVRERRWERFGVTFNPGGFLRRL